MRRRTFLQLCALLAAGYYVLLREEPPRSSPDAFRDAVDRGGGVDPIGSDADTSALRIQNARLRSDNQRRQAAIDRIKGQADLALRRPAAGAAAAAAAAVAAVAAPPAAPRLIIAVNTIPRPVDNATGVEPDYLLRALESISEQIDGAAEGKFAVYVLNLRPGDHALFAAAQQRYGADPHFVFAETHPDPEDADAAAQAEADGLGGTEDDAGDGTQGVPLPGLRNRQQTRDVARLTRTVHHRFPRSPYTLYIEDDFILCQGALGKLNGLVAADSGIDLDWTAMRVSYGLCGVMMQRKDMLPFASYLLAMQFFRPVDILAYYWFARESSQRQPAALAHFGSDRTNLNYRHNLLNHIGAVSTYPGRPARQFAGCTDVLVVWSLHKHERFDLEACPGYMLSPCPSFDPWPSQVAKDYLSSMANPETLDQDHLALPLPLPGDQQQEEEEEEEGLPYPPTVFIATADAIAGETIPHTAPWELGTTLRTGREDDTNFAADADGADADAADAGGADGGPYTFVGDHSTW